MTESTTVVPTVVLRRSYATSRERVFSAWTTPEIAATFMGPGEVKATNIRMDVRTGGTYSITMLRPDGEELVATGTYREVVAPQRLAMTWRWKEDDPADEYDSLLTLEFNQLGDQTELVLTHAQLPDADSCARHAEGWNAILDQLSELDLGR